ncbi:MAG: DJ-1/PfpI family protein [Planctomycetaceae bacterium]|jgi:protease I|nr:DJ-1/PfpI family protein [Planctomycetaceae bacterium]
MPNTTRREFFRKTTALAAAVSLSAGVSIAADSSPKAKQKILLPIGDATETLDTFYPLFRLTEAGYEVVVCGPEARKYHTVLHEVPPDSSIPWDITQERPGYFIQATAAFRDIKPEDFCSIFTPGGRAPEYLRYDKDLVRLFRHFHETKKPIASVCHGIELLTAGDCIRGKKVTAVPKCKLDAEQGGATYINEPVVRDGNVISCQGYADYPVLFVQYMKMLDEAKR